ncbi:MAG TPA: helicase-related protein [Vicinamibacteria bacterium]|nr:helicase-related protein [Vicinamibacteria bacterium]
MIIDEAHALKHGFDPKGSNRNRVLGMALGHPVASSDEYPWYQRRVRRVLLLSATPFEYDYRDVFNQLDVLGFGDAKLQDADGGNPISVRRLDDPECEEEEKREVLKRMLLRRVGYLKIADQKYSKNMYRREWRAGGYDAPSSPMRLEDPKQRLVVGLIQKKVAEALRDKRFNNHFQIGMLSSFESFLETVGHRKRLARQNVDGNHDGERRHFEGEQEASVDERRGADTFSLATVVDSYSKEFGEPLPHPKLDATARSLASAFDTGDKALVFVRRVATVTELKKKLDTIFDDWIYSKMVAALPELKEPIDGLFSRYRQERERASTGPKEDSSHEEVDQVEEDLRHAVVDDEGGNDTFFAWFFRGEGPGRVLSGAAFQKNRLSSMASVYSTLFEDDYVAWLLGQPSDPLEQLANMLARSPADLQAELKQLAYNYFRSRSQQKSGYPRFYVVEAYQAAALQLLRDRDGDLGPRASVVLQERFPLVVDGRADAPERFPPPSDGIGIVTFFTELVKTPNLRRAIWPEDEAGEFRERFRNRERRRELISAMSRLGASYIDLYLTAIRRLGSFGTRKEMDAEQPERVLTEDFIELLTRQSTTPGFHAFRELSGAAAAFETLLSVNFPDAHHVPLAELPEMFGRSLQHQVPVGRMSGGVNKRLVQQFRMPGFPLTLVTTDVLQEGEDLHTFCRRVIHYGITWTPSAMEQRTGRIDRIGSLVQRHLDGRAHAPGDDELIQVYYPHLRDTVEVLQVRRVLVRLNKFLRMIHRSENLSDTDESRIDIAQEAIRRLEEVPRIEGLLESAFPVHPPWLCGTALACDIQRLDITALERHLGELWSSLVETWDLAVESTGNPRRLAGTVALSSGRCIRADERSTPSVERRQPFTLELRSLIAGDATLLECTSPVGQIDLDDPDESDHLYELQQRLGAVRICAVHDFIRRKYEVSVKGDRVFHLDTTCYAEIERLVLRTVETADLIESEMLDRDSEPEAWLRGTEERADAEA